MKKAFRYLCCIMASVAILLCVVPVSAAYLSNFELNTSTQVYLSEADDYCSFWFTAPESCVYKFYSAGNYDTIAYVVDSQNNTIAYGDDCNEDLNFAVYVYLEAGSTYGFIADFIDDETTGSFNIELVKTSIKSVQIDDVTVYEGVDSIAMPDYNPETDQYDIEYMYYHYTPSFTVTLNNGTVLQSDEYGILEYDGQSFMCECTDDQSAQNEWTVGSHTAIATVFGISQSINVYVEENPVESVRFHDITLYDDLDCLIIDEEWEEILGIEIPEPIKVFIYVPQYTATFKDGTVLQSNELGMIEYNGNTLMFEDLTDDQYFDNQWGIGEHTSQASFLGVTGTFKVTVEASPVKDVKFDDVVLLKDWDCYTDYEYNPETDEYDLAWQRYYYMPSYTVTLNDGTVLKSDENGFITYNGKLYMTLNMGDGQSYENQWTAGTHTVEIKAFGNDGTFNVIIEEMVSVKGDFNRDGTKNNKDLGLLMQYLNGWDVRIDKGACDVNGDGVTNNKDYGLFMQFLNGWDVELK